MTEDMWEKCTKAVDRTAGKMLGLGATGPEMASMFTLYGLEQMADCACCNDHLCGNLRSIRELIDSRLEMFSSGQRCAH